MLIAQHRASPADIHMCESWYRQQTESRHKKNNKKEIERMVCGLLAFESAPWNTSKSRHINTNRGGVVLLLCLVFSRVLWYVCVVVSNALAIAQCNNECKVGSPFFAAVRNQQSPCIVIILCKVDSRRGFFMSCFTKKRHRKPFSHQNTNYVCLFWQLFGSN